MKAVKLEPAEDHIPNLGLVSRRWLESVGIRSLGDLRKAGAVGVWWRVHEAGHNPTLNLLYAPAGALCREHWAEPPPDVKRRLQKAVRLRQP